MEQLVMREKHGANYVLLEISGNLNSYTSQEFSEKVFAQILEQNVVVDMSQIGAIDSTGLGIILAGFNDGEDAGHRLYVMNPSPAARTAIDDTGFSSLFRFIHSVTEVE